MNSTFQILEFDHILNQLEENALTKAAKEKIRAMEPYLQEKDVRHSLRETTEARTIIDKIGLPPAVSMEGLDEILLTVSQGGILSAGELEAVGMTLTAVKRLKDFLERSKYLQVSLSWYEEQLDPLKDLQTELADSVRGGRVEDHASRLLASLRKNIERMEDKVREKAESILRSKKQCFSDSYVTVRNGRLCLPVKKDYKASVPGSVIDKSATGSTLFIEPQSVAELSAELELLRMDEENETRRILCELTTRVEQDQEVFLSDKRMIEKLDYLFAKGKLSAQMDAKEPSVNTERRIEIRNGRHPLLDRQACVPLNFRLGQEGCGIVITGPNTGGKTVAIKTVGLLSLMAQCGLHVPCESADLCMNNQVLCDIGDGQNITENLSTFSAHITNVLDILKKAGPESLVIMDELGSGTDPAEGMGIAVAILEELREIGCLFLVTTHYPEVKTYADQTEGVLNARMAFDKESLKPLYSLEIGEAGESCALSIAKRLGMPDEMLKRAEAAAYGVGRERKQEPYGNRPPSGTGPHIKKQKQDAGANYGLAEKFKLGDSVMVYPDKKIGIVCKPINDKGVLCVQLREKKIWISHKRVKLHVKAEELYPADYDFSILFDSVETRKARHKMDKGHQEGLEVRLEDGFGI